MSGRVLAVLALAGSAVAGVSPGDVPLEPPGGLAVIAPDALAPVPAELAHAPTSYSIEDLGTLPGDDMADIWNGNFMNNHGDVALTSFNNYEVDDKACLWKEKTGLQQLPVPPGTLFSRPWGLNDGRQAAGIVVPVSGPQRAVRWDKSGVTLLPVPSGWSSWANDINNRGEIAGAIVDSAPPYLQQAIIWGKDSTTNLRKLAGTDNCAALCINNRGQAAGWCATANWEFIPTLWEGDTVTALPGFGGTLGIAVAIHDNGWIVGTSQTAAGQDHGALWVDGVVIDLTPGFQWEWTGSSNARGQVVLWADDGSTGGHTYLWQDGMLTDLQDLLPAGSGWTLWYAFGINERGQISGAGDHNGKMRVFLMTPRG